MSRSINTSMPETIDSIKGKTNVVFAFTDLIKPPEEAHQKALEIAAKEIKESNKIVAHLEKHLKYNFTLDKRFKYNYITNYG